MQHQAKIEKVYHKFSKTMFEHLLSNTSSDQYEPHFSLMFENIVIYSCMAVISLVGSTVICIVIVGNKFLHTASNCYLIG